jgi:hypothetical protein
MPINRKNSPNQRHKLSAGSSAPVKRQLGDRRAASSESNAEDSTAVPAVRGAQVSFFITQAQKAQLRAKGYSDTQIAQMKPAEAHKILGLE